MGIEPTTEGSLEGTGRSFSGQLRPTSALAFSKMSKQSLERVECPRIEVARE